MVYLWTGICMGTLQVSSLQSYKIVLYGQRAQIYERNYLCSECPQKAMRKCPNIPFRLASGVFLCDPRRPLEVPAHAVRQGQTKALYAHHAKSGNVLHAVHDIFSTTAKRNMGT